MEKIDGDLQTLIINTSDVVQVDSFRFLGLHISQKNHVIHNTTTTTLERAQQRLYFIRKLKKGGLSCQALTQAYRGQ